MAVVATYKLGCATVRIHDDYIEKDPVKHQEIIDRAFEIVERAMIRHALEDEKRQKALLDEAEAGGTKEIDTRGKIKSKDREGICAHNEEALF